MKTIFRKIKFRALSIRRVKRIARTKDRLHQNLRKIQAGHNIPADIREMRTMSRMLRRDQYGTTQPPHDPLKLDLTSSPKEIKKVLHHIKHCRNMHRDERPRN